MKLSKRDRDCLNYDPFEGDRDSNARKLRDVMVTARYPHVCHICFGPILKFERHRALTEISYDDRKVMTFRFCFVCCEAMAASWNDNGEWIERRTSIGMKQAKQLSDTKPPEGER